MHYNIIKTWYITTFFKLEKQLIKQTVHSANDQGKLNVA